MQGFNILILLVAVSSASACKYFCRKPGTFKYECCDDGNPYLEEEDATGSASEENTTEVSDDASDATAEADTNNATQPPSNCYYYCAYDGQVYCCGDTSEPIPESHANHDGSCAEENEQVCKNNGVYLNSKKYQSKTSGAIRLVSGPAKEKPSCASDGYCAKEERCCPSPCAKRHVCMKALDGDE